MGCRGRFFKYRSFVLALLRRIINPNEAIDGKVVLSRWALIHCAEISPFRQFRVAPLTLVEIRINVLNASGLIPHFDQRGGAKRNPRRGEICASYSSQAPRESQALPCRLTWIQKPPYAQPVLKQPRTINHDRLNIHSKQSYPDSEPRFALPKICDTSRFSQCRAHMPQKHIQS